MSQRSSDQVPQAEVIGVEGMRVTEVARTVVERAGYAVHVTAISAAELSFVKVDLGTSVLPAVKTDDETLQGMEQIRTKFGS